MRVRLQTKCNRPPMSAISATTEDDFIQVESVQDNERTVFYIPVCVGSNQCRMRAISPSAGFRKYSNCFVISKGQIVLFNYK